jgi:hypothetical protein
MRFLNAITVLILIPLFQNLCWAQSDTSDLCRIAKEIVATQSIELGFESRLAGKCHAAIYYSGLPKKLNVDAGEYYCDMGKVVILTDDMIFSEGVKYVIQLDRFRKRRAGIFASYSIIEFLHNKKQGENKRLFLKGKIRTQ